MTHLNSSKALRLGLFPLFLMIDRLAVTLGLGLFGLVRYSSVLPCGGLLSLLLMMGGWCLASFLSRMYTLSIFISC